MLGGIPFLGLRLLVKGKDREDGLVCELCSATFHQPPLCLGPVQRECLHPGLPTLQQEHTKVSGAGAVQAA